MIRKIKLYIALVAVLLSASSCLDKYPQDAIPQDDAIYNFIFLIITDLF